MKSSSACVQEYNQNSIFSQAYGKNLPPSSKPDAPMVHQEPSLYSLFEGTPWSPSLPASSGTSQRSLIFSRAQRTACLTEAAL